MSKNKCAICGTVIKNGQVRCNGCGMPQVDLKKMAKGNFDVPNRNNRSTKILNDETLFIIDRLDLYAKLIKILLFFSLIGIFIYSIFTLKWVLILGCVVFYFVLPFVTLPISWMRMMLKNLYEIRNNLK